MNNYQESWICKGRIQCFQKCQFESLQIEILQKSIVDLQWDKPYTYYNSAFQIQHFQTIILNLGLVNWQWWYFTQKVFCGRILSSGSCGNLNFFSSSQKNELNHNTLMSSDTNYGQYCKYSRECFLNEIKHVGVRAIYTPLRKVHWNLKNAKGQ